MPARKTAIALPEDLLHDVDRAAKDRGESRSRYIARVLRTAVRARRDADITRRLDALFADETVRGEQASSTRALDAAGNRWDDERW